ncbi:MAG TPA: hypothetical protein VGH66_11630 [Acidimicrobiales bacterium]
MRTDWIAKIKRTTPTPTTLRMANMALTWPLGAVMSRAGVEGGGVPVGMALREVGGAGAVDVGGAWGAGDLWLGGSVREVARVGVRPTEPAAGVVTGALAVVAVGRVTWLVGAGVVAGGTVAAGALVTGARGVVTGATVGDVVGSPAATRAMVSTPPGRAGAGEVGPAPTITTVSHSPTTTAPELVISLNLSLVMAPVWSVANSLYEIFAGMVVLLPSRPMTIRRSHPVVPATTRRVMASAKCPSSRATAAVPGVGHRSQIHTSAWSRRRTAGRAGPQVQRPRTRGSLPLATAKRPNFVSTTPPGWSMGPHPWST